MEDTRDKFWAEWELKIQQRARKKNKIFVWFLTKLLEIFGILKLVKEQDGFKIYSANGEWLRNNLIPDFEHAGHGFVHLPIPMNHIWIDTRHYEGCSCKNVRPDRKMSKKFFESTGIIHEPAEFKEMEKGIPYWPAHQIALEAERKAGILKDPYCEEYAEEELMEKNYCLFCDKDNPQKHRIICQNKSFYARWDNFPITQGHAEIVPKKHIISFFELNKRELRQFYELLKEVKGIIDEKYHPDGYNAGNNEGEAGGRTIHHFHFHIIPRYKGDVENPKGGIRNIIPGKGDYTSK